MVFIMVLLLLWPWHKFALHASLTSLELSFLVTDRPEDHESLVEDFLNTTNTIDFSSSTRDIVKKCFLVLRLWQETNE